MAPPARPGRGSSRPPRATMAVLSGFLVVLALAATGSRGAVDDVAMPEASPVGAGPPPAPTSSPAVGTGPLAAPASPPPTPTPAPTPTARPRPRPVDPYALAQTAAKRVTDRADGWASFTLLDRKTGKRLGDARSYQTTFVESTIKAWLAADLLATRARAGVPLSAYETARMSSMIRLSDDNAAEVIWRWLGADDAIEDMAEICGLKDTRVYPGWWSKTEISSRDLAALGDCIVPGKGRFLSPAAGAPLLALMRSVDRSDAFGIQQVDPAGKGVRIAVKNGWTQHGSATGNVWNVNCLGIWGAGNRWVLAVATRYPVGNGLDYGASLCRQVTRAVLVLTRPPAPTRHRRVTTVPSPAADPRVMIR